MIDKPISLVLTRLLPDRGRERFVAELSPEQFKAIQQEFISLCDAEDWSEYCAYTRGERGLGPAAPFVEPFEDKLATVIHKHTPYGVAMFWDVLWALAAEAPTP